MRGEEEEGGYGGIHCPAFFLEILLLSLFKKKKRKLVINETIIFFFFLDSCIKSTQVLLLRQRSDGNPQSKAE